MSEQDRANADSRVKNVGKTDKAAKVLWNDKAAGKVTVIGGGPCEDK